MVAFLRRQRLILPLAPLCGAVFGGVLALLFLLLPAAWLESIVVESGIASILTAAEPPLGLTARAMLAMVGGGGAGLITWFALFLLVGSRTVAVNVGSDGDVPVLRRADAHPDAPARSPLRATRDLGTPFLDVRAKAVVHLHAEEGAEPKPESPVVPIAMPRPLPKDLDTPLADYDPDAWLEAEPVRNLLPPPSEPLKSLAPLPIQRPQVFDENERFETFELTPIRRDPPVPEPDRPSATIHALLDRLERSVAQRDAVRPAPVQREETLQDALANLRQLAQRRA